MNTMSRSGQINPKSGAGQINSTSEVCQRREVKNQININTLLCTQYVTL